MLHRKAGSRELVEVHGTIEHSSCLSVPRAGRARGDARAAARPTITACRAATCGAPLKPDVVLFGELLPEDALERAYELAQGADVLLCVGSSLEVHPVAQLPSVTRRAGGDVAIVTQGPTPCDGDRRGEAQRRRRRGAQARWSPRSRCGCSIASPAPRSSTG